ncbi:hypothetical protein HJC10_42425, partial [Corallococcus exiguus]|nr:hypothetical protein [Corallococcus exiguus]
MRSAVKLSLASAFLFAVPALAQDPGLSVTSTSRPLPWLCRQPAGAAGTVEEIALEPGASPVGITVGPDGHVWFTQPGTNRIGRATRQGVVSGFDLPTPFASPQGITAGLDGNVWFTELGAGRIGRITPAGVVTEFPLPQAGSAPSGITAGLDGNVWFTEQVGNRIGRITPAGVIMEFEVPTPE